MAPKKSSKRSESTRNGAASMRLKKLIGRRSKSSKDTIWRLFQLSINQEREVRELKILYKNQAREVKSLKKRIRKMEMKCTVNLSAGLESNPRSLVSQAESSGQRRLQLYFVYELPNVLFTSDIIYVTGTQPQVPVMVGILDENNVGVNEAHLSAFPLEVFVVDGEFKVEESEDWKGAELVRARKRKGSLLVGSCARTMEDGVCCFDDLKFVDNSSWVPSQMFRLMVRVAKNVQAPDMVEIRPAVSGPFRVKDQRVKPYEKNPIPSWDDDIRRLKKIGKESHGRLKEAGILNMKDFLQEYYIDQSSLRKILGVKKGAWETIIQHATKCIANGEHFQYDSGEGVLFFDCFYKLIGVSFGHQHYRSVDSLLPSEKSNVEQLRRRAFEDKSKLVQINNFPDEWLSASTSLCMAPYTNPHNQDQLVPAYQNVLSCPSFPQSPLLDPKNIDSTGEYDASQSAMEGIRPFLRSDSLLEDLLVIGHENHPLYMMNSNDTANYMVHGQGSSESEPFHFVDFCAIEEKDSIFSWDDEVLRLKKIGKESHGRLKEAGILNVKDFLQEYYKDQSSLCKILVLSAPSIPQLPLLEYSEILYHQPEDSTCEYMMDEMCSFLRSN